MIYFSRIDLRIFAKVRIGDVRKAKVPTAEFRIGHVVDFVNIREDLAKPSRVCLILSNFKMRTQHLDIIINTRIIKTMQKTNRCGLESCEYSYSLYEHSLCECSYSQYLSCVMFVFRIYEFRRES